MFSFFNKKNTSLPAGQFQFDTDIHSHILPGIDDGSPNLETSLQLISGLYALGIRKCVATPHIIGDLYRNDANSIGAALDEAVEGCKQAGIQMEISAAAEYMLDDYFMQLLRQKKPLLCLHKNILLTELPYSIQPDNIEDLVFNMLTEGYKPVLAHPERYVYFHRNYKFYSRLKDLGFILQVNLLSLTGYYGDAVKKAAIYLFKNDMVSLVGTDLHHHKHLAALANTSSQRIFNQYLPGKDWNNLNALANQP